MTTPVFTGDVFVIQEENNTPNGNVSRMVNVAEEFLFKANNLSDIPNRNTARENLGITSSPVKPIRPKVNDLWIDLSE